jgi:CMP-N-acetylneuraminic acid synthetase
MVPAVTVYITNHNYGRFIGQAIESVLKQTLRDFELLIIDDGSTDDSREVIERYAKLPGVYTVFQDNRGLNVTNNIALRMARGRYIMRLDADDYLEEHALTILAGVLDRQPDVGLVFPDYFVVDEHGRCLEVVRRHDFDEVTLLDQPAHGACTLARRECLLQLGGYDEGFQCQDGYDLWVRFIQRYRVQNVNLPLFYYRQHAASLTRNEEKILKTRAQILEKRAGEQGVRRRVVAVLPIRGAGIDPRNDALRNLAGRPLIEWSLDAALKAERVAQVVVTTPDRTILDHVARRYGNRVQGVLREPHLARLNTHVDASVLHAVDEVASASSELDLVSVLTIESPFRGPREIDAAVHVLELFGPDCVVGVRPEVDAFYRHQGAGLVPVRNGKTLRLEADELYRKVGHFAVTRRQFLAEQREIVGGRIGHLVLGERAAFGISSELDWRIAEFYAESHPDERVDASAITADVRREAHGHELSGS